ncbi:MAG: APC family permease [Conexibacteraceae bacterium]|nr:APC family permease [Conexibacteraceae bacterium]
MTATATGGEGFEERAVFVRKATGLVRGWSVRDAFVYATFAINLVTLGWFIFASAPFIPNGGLLWSVVVGGAFLVFQAITYAGLISVMPRAGGDYVWMSRVLGGGIGFVLAVAGWWFILWYWVPIYANILNIEVLGPLSAIVGWHGGVTFWGGDAGIFVASVITALLASLFIALGIRTYGRIQKFCFYGGVAGLVIMGIILLVTSHGSFINHFNSQAHSLYGTSGNAYAATLKAGTQGYTPTSVGHFNFSGVLLLIPMLMFFNLWSNWGATLYGEVRGASDFRKNIYAMGGALIGTTIVAGIFFLLFAKTFGWNFYMAGNNAFYLGTGPTGVFPYPALLAAMIFSSPVLQFILISIMSLWFFGWVGSVFLSSTRVVFAASFDRILPEKVASVSRNGVPYWALALMLLPSIPLAALYAWSLSFRSYTLDATLVIAITFLGTTISAAILPWRKPEIYNASPIAKYKVLGLPLITFAAIMFAAILIWALIKWFSDSAYGVNNSDSFILMGGMYVLAIAIYVVSQIVRRRQGIDLGMVYGEIPAE